MLMMLAVAAFALAGSSASPCVEFLSPAGPASFPPIPVAAWVDPSFAPEQLLLLVDGVPVVETSGHQLAWQVPVAAGSSSVHLRVEAARGDRVIFAERTITIRWPDSVVDVSLVLVPAIVTDRHGRIVGGLTRDDFELKVDRRPVEITYFDDGNAPFSVAIVIDCSSSMVGDRFAAALRAAGTLVDSLAVGDQALLIGFDHRIHLYSPLTAEAGDLHRALLTMRTGGGTSLYDALGLAIELLQPVAGRKAVVLLSDGEDAMSRSRPGAVERAAKRSHIVLYPFSIEQGLDRRRAAEAAPTGDAKRLANLAEDLGGRAFYPRTEGELLAGYRTVFDEMRAQYTLGFSPRSRFDGRLHRIDVKIERRGLKVRARKGWLADR